MVFVPTWITALVEELTAASYFSDLVASVILGALVLILRAVVVRSLLRIELPPEARRRWLVQIRYVALAVFVLALVIIWADELRTVALSFVAIAAAVVLATKELIMCISGSVLRGTARGFSIGDRIEVGSFRGDVIDIGVLTTTLLDVGPHPAFHQWTGRSVVLPNSMFLSQPVINETFTHSYVLHVLVVPASLTRAREQIEDALLAAATAECEEFLEQARVHIERVSAARGLEAPNVEPRVSLRLAEADTVEYILRFPAPARHRGRVEQAILKRFLVARQSINID